MSKFFYNYPLSNILNFEQIIHVGGLYSSVVQNSGFMINNEYDINFSL